MTGQLHSLEVLPGHWRRGIGTRLLAACLDVWQEQGRVAAVLEVWERNGRARAFYHHHGWVHDGHTRPGPGGAAYLRLGRPVPGSRRPPAGMLPRVRGTLPFVDLPRDDVDPSGLLEYSVVFTDRSLNHMSQRFIGVMQDIVDVLRTTYRADTVAVVPGGGTYAMEAVARQLATGRRCLVVRNGLFSYRWSQILQTGDVTDDVALCLARPDSGAVAAAWSPAPAEEVAATIRERRPEVVFAPHVETAAGMLLPDDYVRTVAEATHEVGGLFVLDCIASGALWVDMRALGVDVLLSAPQKGWSGSPCAGFVMLGDRARARVEQTTSTSFAANLRTWLSITEGYTRGEAAYHATMPTDALAHDAELMLQTREQGLEELRAAQWDLGTRVRALLADRGLPSVAAEEFAAPSVVVVHTDDPALRSGAAFTEVGVQVAAGVPLQCGEPDGFSTFRIGLFGLDKLTDVEGTASRLQAALDRLGR